VREIVVVSGKGGTGKTSLTASFAVLASRPVVADADVDAADLHLVLSPTVLERHEFRSGHLAVVNESECNGCGVCSDVCRFDAVRRHEDPDGGATFAVDPTACEGCGACVRFCPEDAIGFPERRSGEWMVSTTRCGPMVHARLATAEGSSGKLVTVVRQEARRIAAIENRNLVLLDGPPGVSCPVIASVTGADLVVAVTEPTVSGEHDLERLLRLTRHFDVPAAVCVNKWDLDPEGTERIEGQALRSGARLAGRVRYDSGVTAAQMERRAVVETDAPSAADVRRVWEGLTGMAG
jgi:MinD superfamily P-loop ATPase